MKQRINKFLAHLGLGSRRAIDAMIERGEVLVNGLPAKRGQQVSTADTIEVRGQIIDTRPKEPVILAFNKPKGVTTTKRDRFARVTIMDFLPREYHHLYPVGRLDRDSRGLLLLTNDGDLALQLQHPRFAHEKEYSVRCIAQTKKTVQDFQDDMDRLSREIILPSAQSQPVTLVSFSFNPTTQVGDIQMVLKEGKKRQIRRLMQALGYWVDDLERLRIGSIRLENLKEGTYRKIDKHTFL